MTTLLAHDYYGHAGGWWFFAPLLWIGFFILFFGVLRGFFWRRHWRRHGHSYHSSSARTVLAERYARGEIDETEYRQRLSVLDGPSK